MLYLNVTKKDAYNEKTNRFISVEACTLCLEHSLVSISKWEAKWHKPFLGDKEKTDEELRDYIKCMTITQNVRDEVYQTLSVSEIKLINDYIGDPSTATTFTDRRPEGSGPKRSQIITSELIYSWMVSYKIPFECQRWHLNRLLTLIRICNINNSANGGKKMSRGETLSRNRALNAARRSKLGSKG